MFQGDFFAQWRCGEIEVVEKYAEMPALSHKECESPVAAGAHILVADPLLFFLHKS